MMEEDLYPAPQVANSESDQQYVYLWCFECSKYEQVSVQLETMRNYT